MELSIGHRVRIVPSREAFAVRFFPPHQRCATMVAVDYSSLSPREGQAFVAGTDVLNQQRALVLAATALNLLALPGPATKYFHMPVDDMRNPGRSILHSTRQHVSKMINAEDNNAGGGQYAA